jgi:PBP1b-binding outer membrane lipoprotein LpoB
MKHRIIVLIILFLFIAGCKSSKKAIQYDTYAQTEQKAQVQETLGLVDSSIFIEMSTRETEVIKYEPVYYQKDGKEVVELKPVTYRKINTNKKTEETIKIDTTSTSSELSLNLELSDNTSIKKEFKGYDILGSIISGVTTVLTGPFKYMLWLIGVIFIIPIYRFIKRKIKNNSPKI